MAFQDDFPERCAEAVAELESTSAAEVVVVVAPYSGHYHDLDLLWGLVFGLASLAYMLHSRFDFHPDFVLLNVVLAGVVGWFLSRSTQSPRRLWCRQERRQHQVRLAAQSAFADQGLSATRDRSGLLLYISLWERLAVVQPDYGVDGALPRAIWNEVRHRFGQATTLEQLEEALFASLEQLREPLSQALPRAEDDRDELPNAPVMMS